MLYFVLCAVCGLLVYGYDGRSISNPRLAAGVHPQFLKRGNIAISSDAIAIIDRALPTRNNNQHNSGMADGWMDAWRE